jgi:hypothetical protein
MAEEETGVIPIRTARQSPGLPALAEALRRTSTTLRDKNDAERSDAAGFRDAVEDVRFDVFDGPATRAERAASVPDHSAPRTRRSSSG